VRINDESPNSLIIMRENEKSPLVRVSFIINGRENPAQVNNNLLILICQQCIDLI
jgi:hypothetical protein